MFLESAPDAIVVTDGAGRIVAANRLAEEMFGYPRDHLVGDSIEKLVPEGVREVHARHRATYADEPRTRAMGTGRRLTGRRQDGTEFQVEISLSPLRGAAGPLVIGIIRDLTDRIKAEAKFHGFLESAPDAVVVIDRDGHIAIVNSLTEQMFGYAREELLGRPVEVLVPERLRRGHTGHREGYSHSPKTRPMGAGQNLLGRRKDGSEFPVEISLSPLETEQGTWITSIIRDITQRKEAEAQIQASLREKEVLLKEIHHRVKNNLQVTSSLLRLQGAHIQDPRAREMFADSQHRIRSMALVHEKLYQSSDLSRIHFGDYARSLAGLLFRSYGMEQGRVVLEVEGDEVFLSVETAVPCGLILNELLSNSLKHAFPDGRRGRMVVRLERHGDGRLRFTVTDDGVGLPDALDLVATETLGLQLVRTLAQQLEGTLIVRREKGAAFEIDFPESRG
jgi:PAS domain S-box-containing protein